MKKNTLALLLLLCATIAQADILVRSDPTLAPVRPADRATVTQSPPEFTWPPQSGKNTYELAVTFPDGRVETRKTDRNWVLWDKPMPAGKYSWTVKVVAGASNEKSQPRAFVIAKDAVPFVVPSP